MTAKKVAIVTAAGRGIGAAIAKELAVNDYILALMSPSGAAKKLAKSLVQRGVNNCVVICIFRQAQDTP